MNFPSVGTPEFWRQYRALPAETRATARKTFQLWSADAMHPSLHFKKIGQEKWSVRVGMHYRAIGKFNGDTLVWNWIGSHADYDKQTG